MATFYGDDSVHPARGNRWQDWANMILAVWLFVSPWILHFGAGGGATGQAAGTTAAWDAWVLGVIVFLVALSAIGRMRLWQEWLTLLLGAWIFAAPWALGFTGLRVASVDHWALGLLIFLISLSNMTARSRAVPTGAVPPGPRVQ